MTNIFKWFLNLFHKKKEPLTLSDWGVKDIKFEAAVSEKQHHLSTGKTVERKIHNCIASTDRLECRHEPDVQNESMLMEILKTLAEANFKQTVVTDREQVFYKPGAVTMSGKDNPGIILTYTATTDKVVEGIFVFKINGHKYYSKVAKGEYKSCWCGESTMWLNDTPYTFYDIKALEPEIKEKSLELYEAVLYNFDTITEIYKEE